MLQAKKIALTQGKHVIVDASDYDWLSTWNWFAVSMGETWYARTNYKDGGMWHTMQMHRLLTLCPKGLIVDHINHNGLDNRKSNLRIVTRMGNSQNRRNHGLSQYAGVQWHEETGKWRARIRIDGKDYSLGLHHSELEAAKAHDALSIEKGGLAPSL